MTAGVPGIGLGGLFHLVSALLGPLVELVRTVRGRSSRRRWLGVMRAFALAVAMLAAIDATFRAIFLFVPARAGHSGLAIPIVPIAMTLSLLALLLAVAKGAQLAASARRGSRRSLIRTVRGRSSRARWASVARQLLIAVAMISVVGAMLGVVGLVSGAGLIQGLSFSLLVLTVTTGILAFLVVSAKLVQLCSRGARRGRRTNFERRLLEPLAYTALALALAVATASVLRGRDAYEVLTVTEGRDSATAALAWIAQGAAEINAPAGSPGLILVALALVMTTWTLVPLALARRLVRSASAVSLALLAAWLIALGVSGGELLPGLPGSQSTRPSEASPRTQNRPAPAPAQSHPQSHQSTRAVRTASPSPARSGSASGTSSGSGTAGGTGSGSAGGTSNGSGSGTTDSQGSNPKPTAPQPVQSPSTPSTPPSTSQGQGTTPTTGAPTDSPGNLPSDSQAPGQLP